jgi:hypothetical protein
MTGFTAPAVMSALAVAFARTDIDGEVYDGPGPGDSAAMEVISIGFTGPDDDSSAEASVVPAGLGPREREGYDVNCAVAVASGDAGAAERRARAFGLLAQCRAQLLADPTLAGACMRARIASWALREDSPDSGSRALIRFAVNVDAFTQD